MSSRSKYVGPKTKLAVAIDVGTTHSGASYTFLKPGEVPRIYDVTGFKGQENRESNTKVPTILFYSQAGDLLACGAEAKRLRPSRGIKTEWFKLALHPPSMAIDDSPTVHLPPGRTATDALGDFLKYMYDCVQTHIINTHVDGQRLWSSLNGATHFILSHPNGWGSYQQGTVRSAAIRGGLLPDTPEGRERIEFVTEGEASFHWCIDQAIAGGALKTGTSIVVADLGGGTIDISSYIVGTLGPLRLQEQMAPECVLAGSITVTDRFVRSVAEKLRGTPYSDEDYMLTLRGEFDEDTKCLFREDGESEVYVRIGGRRDNFQGENGLCKIEGGLLEVQRQDIVEAFQPSVDAIVDGIRKRISGPHTAHVFLVGGFAASPWVLSETRRRLRMTDIPCEVKRADSNTAKAVAHGGVAFYLDRYVTERTMRHTYGVFVYHRYDSSDPEHQTRVHKLDPDPISGTTWVKDGFAPIVRKSQVVGVESVHKHRHEGHAHSAPTLVSWSQTIHRYHGTRNDIRWSDLEPSAFEEIGQFRCEIPASAMKKRTGPNGSYWAADYDVVIFLGTVEIKAYAEWKENGIKKRTWADTAWKDCD